MSTDFFKKKRFFLGIVCIILIAALVFVAIFPFIRSQKVYIGHQFHYLIVNTENVEVGVFNAQLDGGAGYLLNVNGKECVALSVYTNEKNGKAVCDSLQKSGERCALITLGLDSIKLKTREEKKNRQQIIGAFQSFHACLSVLEQEIFRLDKGATQESSKRLLSKLKAQFSFLEKQYSSVFSSYAILCSQTSEGISEILKGEIYTKDLRSVLCEASYGYICLGKSFSL